MSLNRLCRSVSVSLVFGFDLRPEVAISILQCWPAARRQNRQHDWPQTGKQYPPSTQTHAVEDSDYRPIKSKKSSNDNYEDDYLLDNIQDTHQAPLNLSIHQAQKASMLSKRSGGLSINRLIGEPLTLHALKGSVGTAHVVKAHLFAGILAEIKLSGIAVLCSALTCW